MRDIKKNRDYAPDLLLQDHVPNVVIEIPGLFIVGKGKITKLAAGSFFHRLEIT